MKSTKSKLKEHQHQHHQQQRQRHEERPSIYISDLVSSSSNAGNGGGGGRYGLSSQTLSSSKGNNNSSGLSSSRVLNVFSSPSSSFQQQRSHWNLRSCMTLGGGNNSTSSSGGIDGHNRQHHNRSSLASLTKQLSFTKRNSKATVSSSTSAAINNNNNKKKSSNTRKTSSVTFGGFDDSHRSKGSSIRSKDSSIRSKGSSSFDVSHRSKAIRIYNKPFNDAVVKNEKKKEEEHKQEQPWSNNKQHQKNQVGEEDYEHINNHDHHDQDDDNTENLCHEEDDEFGQDDYENLKSDSTCDEGLKCGGEEPTTPATTTSTSTPGNNVVDATTATSSTTQGIVNDEINNNSNINSNRFGSSNEENSTMSIGSGGGSGHRSTHVDSAGRVRQRTKQPNKRSNSGGSLDSSNHSGNIVFGSDNHVSLFRGHQIMKRKSNERFTEIDMNNMDSSCSDNTDEDVFDDLKDMYDYEEEDDNIYSSSSSQQQQKQHNSSHHTHSKLVRIRTGFVDGREIKFYLLENISKKPKTDRIQRQRRYYENINGEKSGYEARIRYWLAQRGLIFLCCVYLASFVAMNVVFAALFYIDNESVLSTVNYGYDADGEVYDDGGSSSSSSTATAVSQFGNIFAFTVQTSTTVGYGGTIPNGHYANFLVLSLNFWSTLLSTIFAGLFFARFVRPEAKIVFSDVMTYCNFNGLPCLSLRVGNVDGRKNKLTNVEAQLTCTYILHYEDENGSMQEFGQTEELKLLNDKLQVMRDVWTLRHVLDESSPLFGLNLNEYPGSSIVEFRVSISAIQSNTRGAISEQTGYEKEDVMIGHGFDTMATHKPETKTVINDYSVLSTTHPQPVWYPANTNQPVMP